MNRFCLVLLSALCPVVLLAEDKKPGPFTSKEGKFTITLPDKPTEKTIKSDLGNQKIDTHLFMVPGKDRAFIVSYTDYPKDKIGDDKDKFVSGVVERNVAPLKGKVASNEKITLGAKKHPGREVRVELADKKQVYRARVYLVGERVYQVVVIGPEEFVKGKEVDDYLSSFKVDE
jgi:hypothetical protein